MVRERRRDRFAEGDLVGILEVGRIGEIDIAVRELVQLEDAAARPGRVALEADAVVGALDLTRPVRARADRRDPYAERRHDREHRAASA